MQFSLTNCREARDYGGSQALGEAGMAVIHQHPSIRAVLIKGQMEPVGEGLMEVIKGHRSEGAIGKDWF